ncbi:CvpA family protein [Pinirhizobacter soli]|uniref:CvpA family protein n=1 Tax=Pinirhizobacter soli TaxID=2786953 RepID=UPI00202A2D03
MTWVDYIIIAVLGLSVLIGLWRGLISEVLALAVWIAAFWFAWTFGPSVATYFEHAIPLPSVRVIVAYGLCFLVVLLLGALLRFLLARLVEGTGLGGTDRLLGMVFGFVRGVLIVTLAVFLLGFTPFTRDPYWRDATLPPYFQGVADWLGERVPENVRRYLHPPADMLDKLPKLPAPAGDRERHNHPAASTTTA